MKVHLHPNVAMAGAGASIGLDRPTQSRPSGDGWGRRVAGPKTASGWELIERKALQEELLAGGVVLLEALSIGEYRSAHLPAALNVPGRLSRRKARLLAPARTAQIVVYGSGAGSEPARRLLARLGALGYGNLRFFSGGKGEWVRFSLPMEYSTA